MKSIEIKSTEQFVPVVLFMLHWIVLKLESVWNAVRNRPGFFKC